MKYSVKLRPRGKDATTVKWVYEEKSSEEAVDKARTKAEGVWGTDGFDILDVQEDVIETGDGVVVP